MKPRYNVSRQNRMRARKVETETTTNRGRNTVECPSCGNWVGNPARLHRNAFGGDCKVVEVNLTELPPVNLPPQPRRAPSTPKPKAERTGVRAWGYCETDGCDAVVSGERRFCGLCLADRMSNRGKS